MYQAAPFLLELIGKGGTLGLGQGAASRSGLTAGPARRC